MVSLIFIDYGMDTNDSSLLLWGDCWKAMYLLGLRLGVDTQTVWMIASDIDMEM